MPARTQDDASPVEPGILANFPAVAKNLDGRGAIIEAITREIADTFLPGERPAVKTLMLLKSNLG